MAGSGRVPRSFPWVPLLVLAGPLHQAFGAGFALIDNSVGGLGLAYAGGAAQARDASTVFFNPAGLARLSGTQLLAGAHLLAPSVKFEDRGSTHLLEQGGRLSAALGVSGSLGSGEGGEAADTVVVPSLYFAHPLSDRLFFWTGYQLSFRPDDRLR